MRFMPYRLLACAAGLITVLLAARAFACDVCGYTFNARRSGSGKPTRAMVMTPTASMLGQGHGSLGFLFEHQRFNSVAAAFGQALNESGHDVHGKDHEEFYNMTAGYGVLENLDLFVTAPIVSKTTIALEDADTLGEKETAVGFGDLRVMGKYRIWQRGIDAALLLGVKAPTGLTSDTKPSGEEFEIEQQPGSGSWDLTTGLAVSTGLTDHLSVASAFRYTERGEGGQDEKLGDVFHYDVGASYALKPIGEHPNVSVVLELHHEWALRDHSRDANRVLDSGGTAVLLAPGLSADLNEALSCFWSMPIPVYQNLGGEHEELKYEIIAGLGWHF